MRQKPYNLDPHTLGGTKASENLAKILMENPRLIRKVSSCYHKFTLHMSKFVKCADHFGLGTLQELMCMYRNKQFNRVKNAKYPKSIESHLLNILTAAYSETLVKIKRIQNDDCCKYKKKEG